MHKITATDPESKSADLHTANIAKLKELFPEVVAEGKVDFNALQEILGKEVESGEEFYRFTWAGKAQARREAHKPSTGTLRPCPEESVDWDSTKNLYIEGDNLEVLKLLQKSYGGKVKMIYIDPPYNTGKDFVYKDNYRDNLRNYKEQTGQVDSEGNTLSTNSDTDGRYHSNWLNMIYPRLLQAKSVLADDGVLMMSIDEKEFHNARKVCDEVFGATNYCGEIIWKNSSKNDQDYISMQHEYFIVYVKNRTVNKGNWLEKKEGLDIIYSAFDGFNREHGGNWEQIHKAAKKWFNQFPETSPIWSSKHYSWMDERGVYFPADISGPNHGQYVFDVIHPTTKEVCNAPASGWRFPQDTMHQRIKDGLVHFGKDHSTVPNNKTYLKDTEYQSVTSVIFKDGRVASNGLKDLFGGKVFTNPKDPDLLARLFKAFEVKENDLVLDFFSGSGSSAEAVMKLNLETGSRCSYILVQLQEDLNQTLKKAQGGAKDTIKRALAYLKGKRMPPFVSELGKERIRLVLARLSAKDRAKLDTGFKVFKLDTSNINAWDGDPDRMQENLLSAAENIKPDRTEADVLYEVLLKYGLDLTLPIEERTIAKRTVYNVGMGALFLCLAEGITSAVAEGIGQWKDELKPETCRVIFRDNGFTDVEKTNAVQTLKRYGVTEVRSV